MEWQKITKLALVTAASCLTLLRQVVSPLWEFRRRLRLSRDLALELIALPPRPALLTEVGGALLATKAATTHNPGSAVAACTPCAMNTTAPVVTPLRTFIPSAVNGWHLPLGPLHAHLPHGEAPERFGGVALCLARFPMHDFAESCGSPR